MKFVFNPIQGSLDYVASSPGDVGIVFPLAPNLGGTGIANAVGSTLTLGGATTVPAPGGTVALLATANVFTEIQTITETTALKTNGLTVKGAGGNLLNYQGFDSGGITYSYFGTNRTYGVGGWTAPAGWYGARAGGSFQIEDNVLRFYSFAAGSNVTMERFQILASGSARFFGNLTVSGILTASTSASFGADVTFANNFWNISTEAQKRFYFLAAGATYFGSANGYIFRNSTDAVDLLTVSNVGGTWWVGDGSGLPYGSCSSNDTDINWTQAAAVQNTWYDISDADMVDGQLNLVTHDGSGKLTVTKAGRYLINYGLVGEANAANTHLETAISVSGTESGQGISHAEAVTPNAERNFSGTAILDLAANATINLSIRTTDAGGPNLKVEMMDITLVMVGGT